MDSFVYETKGPIMRDQIVTTDMLQTVDGISARLNEAPKGVQWEYVGVATESQRDNAAAHTGVAKQTGTIGPTWNDHPIQARFPDPLPRPFTARPISADVLRDIFENYPARTRYILSPEPLPEDGAAIAKRLVANPPEWAYPRAWTCAVLAAMEKDWLNVDGSLTYFETSFGGALESYQRRRISGEMHDRAREAVVNAQAWGPPQTLALLAIEAYVRGLEKPAGLMRRPGVMRTK